MIENGYTVVSSWLVALNIHMYMYIIQCEEIYIYSKKLKVFNCVIVTVCQCWDLNVHVLIRTP